MTTGDVTQQGSAQKIAGKKGHGSITNESSGWNWRKLNLILSWLEQKAKHAAEAVDAFQESLSERES